MRAVVTGNDQPLGAAAVRGLERAGVTVIGLPTVGADRDDTSEIVTGAIASLGGLDVLVICGWDEPSLRPVAFENITDVMFESMWEGGMQGMLWTMQAAIPALRAAGGSVIVLMPTTGMTGGANYAVAAATFEGQRILMKAAARQLGPEGIRVNAIAVGAESVLADVGAADVHYLAPNAIPGELSVDDVTDVIAFLASPAGRRLGGQTITVDGGRWLAP